MRKTVQAPGTSARRPCSIPVWRISLGDPLGGTDQDGLLKCRLASSLLARELKADALLMLTDVDAVYDGWPGNQAKAIKFASPEEVSQLDFEKGSMAPKVKAACEFAEMAEGFSGIGQLKDASAILSRQAGTIIERGCNRFRL